MREHLKRVAKVFTGTTPSTNISRYYDSEDIFWVTPGDISSEGISISEPRKISKSFFVESGIKPYPANIVLMVGIGATVGKVGFFEESCYTNQQINAIVFNETKVLPKFGAYFLLNNSSEINKKTPIVTLQIFNQSKVKQLMIDYPTLKEQQRIVDYLDARLSSIDKRMAVLEKQQDAYTRLKKSTIHQAVTRGLNPNIRLKDSGVEWIGMIPAHWSRFRLKDLGYMYGGLSGKSGDDFRCDDETKTKPYIPFTNVLNHTVIDTSKLHYVIMGRDEQQNKVKENDLIFLMSSEDYESIAKSAVVMGAIGEVYLNSFCRGLRITNKECYAPFLNYQLNSEMYRDALRFEARGFTRINIKVDRVASHFISLPPFSEQQAIAAYLDEKCAKIDAALENIGKQIEASKRLKRAVINEAISGQAKIGNN